MQVILTPTAVPDLFGPGLNGFRNEVPPDPPTQMSAEWLNSVQMELVNAITDQGYALDSLNYSQLTTALNSWSFSGTSSIKSGARLTVLSGGLISVDSGGSVQVASGGMVTLDNGSTLEVSGDFEVLAGGGFSVTPDAIFGGALTVFGQTNLNGDINIGDAAADTVVFNAQIGSDIDVDGFSLSNVGRLALSVGVTPLNAGQLTAGTLGVLRYQPQGTAHYVHTTQKGYVRSVGTTSTGVVVSGNTTSNISSCTITPNVTGDVTVTVIGYLDFSTLATTARVSLRDDTLTATINGAAAGLVEYPITIGGAPVGHSVSFQVKYALPSAVARTFSVRIAASGGDVTYTDVTVVVEGVH